jgi:hypothetical protein
MISAYFSPAELRVPKSTSWRKRMWLKTLIIRGKWVTTPTEGEDIIPHGRATS